MTSWRPACSVQAAERRASLLARVRRFFRERGVLEVEVPALGRAAVTDPQIESLDAGDGDERFYLHTSPEFAMKRLLAAGWPDIVSICRVFRGGEVGRRHQREFTMIEWYRRDFGLGDIAAETVALIAAVLERPALTATVETLEYTDAMRMHAGVDAMRATIDELAAAAGADRALRESIGGARDDWLNLLSESRVAPGLAADRLTVLRHYPASQAALARLCPGNPAVADRFEVYMGAVELANGYVELTDAKEQRRRFEADNEERRARGRPLRPVDQALLAALDAGLPACAGVALGFERLQMLHDGTDDIADVVTFADRDHRTAP